MRRPLVIVLSASAIAIAGCSLVISTDGLSGGPDPSSLDAQSEQASANDASSDAPTVQNGDSEAGTCPGTGGPTMIRVGDYCIDSTEVTNAQYAAFLASSAPPVMPSFCAYRTTHVPKITTGGTTSNWPGPASEDQRPIHNVDWCDAFAFCASTGKRLCGHIGGGASTVKDSNTASLDQWYAACSQGGMHLYPYGNTFMTGACNAKSTGLGHTADVASMTACAGGYPGILQMTGNVNEWADNCEGMTGAGDTCHPRGGGFEDPDTALACNHAGGIERQSAYGDVGIRCCSD